MITHKGTIPLHTKRLTLRRFLQYWVSQYENDTYYNWVIEYEGHIIGNWENQ